MSLHAIYEYSSGCFINSDTSDLYNVIFLRMCAYQTIVTCHMCFYTGYQFTWAERLGQVIICSQSKTSDLVNIILLGRYHKNREHPSLHGFSLQISNPSMPGSIRSRIIRSKSSASAVARPVSPLFQSLLQSHLIPDNLSQDLQLPLHLLRSISYHILSSFPIYTITSSLFSFLSVYLRITKCIQFLLPSLLVAHT